MHVIITIILAIYLYMSSLYRFSAIFVLTGENLCEFLLKFDPEIL